MKKNILVIILLLISLKVLSIEYDVINITNNDGLSNSSINKIFQDNNGLIWIGTWDGLNEYNGREFKIYKPDPTNERSISNNIIRDIIEDDKDQLWIATDRGINLFNLKTKTFEHYLVEKNIKTISNEHAYLIAKNSFNSIFVTVFEQGLFVFDPINKQFVKIDAVKNLPYEKIFFDLDDNLWIHTYNQELYKVVFKKGNNNFPQVENIIKFQHIKNIKSIFSISNNEFLLQTDTNIFYLYNISEGSLKFFPLDFSKIGNTINTVVINNNKLLFGTSNGLFEYDLTTNKLHPILSGVIVLSIYIGSQDLLWVGSDAQGVWLLSPSNQKFKIINSKDIPELGRYPVRSIFEENNILWIGTKGGGVLAFDKDLHRILYHFTVKDGLLNNSVYSIVKGLNSEYWIGTDGAGLNYFDKKTHTIKTVNIIDSLKKKINLSSVYTVLPTTKNTLWVGTSGNGIFKLTINYQTTPYQLIEFKQYTYSPTNPNSLSNNIVYSIIKEDEKHLWIGTRGGGINFFNIITEKFIHLKYNSAKKDCISNDDVICLYKDKSGALWAGTSIGLNKLIRFNNESSIFKQFTEKEGIPNNTIHGIIEDEKNNIWVSTNRGIATLIQDSNHYRIVSYYVKDGLQNNEFSDGASFVDPITKNIYFGGISGLNYFNPEDIKFSRYMPKLILDAFFLDNKETNLYSYIVTDKQKETLVLSYANKSFGFKFSPLDYLSSNKCEIAYQLVNYSNDWINIGTSNTIIFTNVPVGNYILKVKCSNADNIWNEKYYILNIRIRPPWWASSYAYAAYILIFIFLLFTANKLLKYRLNVQHQLQIKEVEKQKAEEIHEAKLSFFTNIAHELSNSLTLIYGPSERLLDLNLNNSIEKKYLNVIKSNSERMQSLIQQMIDFRKAETGHLKIQIEEVDIFELVKFISDNFIDIIEQKRINFTLSLNEDLIWNTDRDCLEKIIFNLLSNAAKYTPNNENIQLFSSVINNSLIIKVINTGAGIKQESFEKIFNRFEVLDRFEMQISKGLEFSNGIGLAICKSLTKLLGGEIKVQSDGSSYTCFEVNLPFQELIEKQQTKNEEILDPISKLNIKSINSNYNELKWEYIDKNKSALVLIIDDEKEIRDLIHDILCDKYQIVEASNGKEAIELMKVRLPAIIVCDVIMPFMNGIDFMKIIKDQELTKHIPIILLSAKSSIENQIEGIEIGANAYLNKPFNPRHLKALVDRLLQGNKDILQFNESGYAAMEQYEGKLIKKEDKILIEKITKIIIDNIDNENLNIEFLANETALSKMQLYRKIKDIIDQTPTEYIRSLRLKHAEKLLTITNKTVQEIMFSCGFNNKTYFYREFFKKYNLTPKEFRTNIKRT